MKRLVVLLLAVIWSQKSLATHVSLFLLSTESRYVENENREYSVQTIRNFSGNTLGEFEFQKFAVALTFENYQLGMETFEWENNSEIPLFGFYEHRREWHTYHLFKMGVLNEWLQFYSGFGVGLYDISVTSQFNGTVSETRSGQILLGSGIASIQFLYKYFHVSTDFKLVMAKDFRPQPMPVLAIKAGVLF